LQENEPLTNITRGENATKHRNQDNVQADCQKQGNIGQKVTQPIYKNILDFLELGPKFLVWQSDEHE
jgi:hypothetical protein